MPMLKLYENIKKLRKANNWTQEELAHKLGYTDRSSIAKIEAGKVDLSQSKIIEFANVFGVDAGDMFGWDEVVIVGDDSFDKNIKARELYMQYEKASPEIRSAIDLLLKSSSPSSKS